MYLIDSFSKKNFTNNRNYRTAVIGALIVSCSLGLTLTPTAALAADVANYNNVDVMPAREAIRQTQFQIAAAKQTQEQELLQQKTLQAEIAASSTAPAANKVKLGQLQSQLKQTQQAIQNGTTTINNLNQWIAYWTQKVQSDAWNRTQDNIDMKSAVTQAKTAAQYRVAENATRRGADSWHQINNPPQPVGVAYDGWTNIPIGCPQ